MVSHGRQSHSVDQSVDDDNTAKQTGTVVSASDVDMVQDGHGATGKEEGATQTSGVSVPGGDVVQCVCGATGEEEKEGMEYVQCEQCLVWQHSECAQFDITRHSSFVCVKCLLQQVCVCVCVCVYTGVQ